jgi:hypothetical protein
MAIHHDVVIDGTMYCLFEDAGVERVKKDVLDAARSGGGFVTVRRGAASSVEVMVTASTPIRIEHTSSDEPRGGEPPAARPTGFGSDDADWWF